MAGMDIPGDSQGWMLLGLDIFLISMTTIIMILRISARGFMTKALGVDDYIAVVAYFIIIAHTALEIKGVEYGAGTSMDQLQPEQINSFFTILPVLIMLYVWSTGMVRFSILAFLPRLSKERWYIRSIWACGLVILTTTLFSFFFVLTECSPILDLFKPAKPDKNCKPKIEEAHVMWAHCIVGICIDLFLFGAPIWVIRSNMMKFNKKTVKVMLVFGIGLLAILTGIIRFIFIHSTNFAENTTLKMVRVTPWTVLEIHLGLWCGSFPALQPLLRLVSFKLNLRSRLESTNQSNTYGGSHPTSKSQTLASSMSHGYPSRTSSKGGGDGSGRVFITGDLSDGGSTADIVGLQDITGTLARTDVQPGMEEGLRPPERYRRETQAWDAV